MFLHDIEKLSSQKKNTTAIYTQILYCITKYVLHISPEFSKKFSMLMYLMQILKFNNKFLKKNMV